MNTAPEAVLQDPESYERGTSRYRHQIYSKNSTKYKGTAVLLHRTQLSISTGVFSLQILRTMQICAIFKNKITIFQ